VRRSLLPLEIPKTMSLVNIDAVHALALRSLAGLDCSAEIEILSYKRNRMISVALLPENTYLVRENGYSVQELTVSGKELLQAAEDLYQKGVFPQPQSAAVQVRPSR